jgi:penicillin G amidase
LSLRRGLALLLAAALGLGALAAFVHRRPLPRLDGRVRVAGLGARVEIVRDRWGVPHIFAASETDAYFGLGYAAAQDRLFQLEVHRRIGQARLAELFGPAALPADRLFRTMDLHGIGKRRLAAASAQVQASAAAYAAGINAAVAASPARPVEFLLLRHSFAPVAADEFVGLGGYLVWILNASWEMDPLYESLAVKVGDAKAALLFPYDRGGVPPVFPEPPPEAVVPHSLSALLDVAPPPAGSNTWAVAPSRSATGHALLASDPHLAHGAPSLWYEVHLHAPGLDVAGVTLPGLPGIVIGHNRRIAWGMTNLMLDAADFFVERVDGTPPRQVMHRGAWVPLRRREERIVVKGGETVTMEVLETPHGPLVNHLVDGATRPLSYQWVHAAAEDSNDFEGFARLNRAHDWATFREALSHLGAAAQNASYADVDGHIGLQASGRIPRRVGRWDGNRFRVGWDGSEEWDGFVPFAQLPSVADPPSGWLAAANNVTVPEPAPYFISSHWEPPDRILRIRAVLAAQPKLSLADMRALHGDVTLAAWPRLKEALRAAFAAEAPDAAAGPVLDRLWRWDGTMSTDSAEAAVFAAFYKHLFHEIVDDEIGALANGYRAKNNLSAIMIEAALFGAASEWLDDVRTPAVEGRDAILRRAMGLGLSELRACCGESPAGWSWGARHQVLLKHPMGRGALLGAYFNLGPFPAPGHALTVNKGEFRDEDYGVTVSPSTRQLIDMGNPADALSILPAGQSGIRASKHYSDHFALWRSLEYHPMLMDRAAIDAVAEGTLILEP